MEATPDELTITDGEMNTGNFDLENPFGATNSTVIEIVPNVGAIEYLNVYTVTVTTPSVLNGPVIFEFVQEDGNTTSITAQQVHNIDSLLVKDYDKRISFKLMNIH